MRSESSPAAPNLCQTLTVERHGRDVRFGGGDGDEVGEEESSIGPSVLLGVSYEVTCLSLQPERSLLCIFTASGL